MIPYCSEEAYTLEKLLNKITESGYELKQPADESEVEKIEKDLALHIPEDLKNILLKTNGIEDEFGGELIWSAEYILHENKWLRDELSSEVETYNFEDYFFFSDAGNGDLLGYRMETSIVKNPQIYLWNHEENIYTEIAQSLYEFLLGWINGSITV